MVQPNSPSIFPVFAIHLLSRVSMAVHSALYSVCQQTLAGCSSQSMQRCYFLIQSMQSYTPIVIFQGLKTIYQYLKNKYHFRIGRTVKRIPQFLKICGDSFEVGENLDDPQRSLHNIEEFDPDPQTSAVIS